jgi:FHA domain
MNLFIEILDGDLKGTRAPLREGLTFGRKDCDVNIRDPKVSSKHARVEIRSDGLFWLVDQGSANGIRTAKLKLTEVPLRAGLKFRLGRTNFEVRDPAVMELDYDPAPLAAPNWYEQIRELAERGIKQAPVVNREILPFHRVVKLGFSRGIQTGTTYFLGYGPREIGATSIDLPLFEPGLPSKCFQLMPENKDAILKVHADSLGKVLLNGLFVETSSLKGGDVIDIGNTRIEVSFES